MSRYRYRYRKLRALIAIAAAAAIVGVASQSREPARAGSTTYTFVAASADTGLIDVNGDGKAEWNSYGATNNGLNVGEQSGDGRDLRYVAPFVLTSEAAAALDGGGSATLTLNVWSSSSLGTRHLRVFALDGGLGGKPDYDRVGTMVADLAPVPGRVGIDVTDALRDATGLDVTFRVQLSVRGVKDGKATYVNVATVEASSPANRPTIAVTAPEPAATTSTTEAAPTTTAAPSPTTAAPTTTTTAAPPPTTAAPTTTTTAPPSPSGWRLVFEDDFDGSTLSSSRWNFDASTFGDGNKELACMTSRPQNVEVSGGTLKIKAQKESGGYACPNETRPSEFPDGRPYTSGAINTSGKFSAAFGRFEMRAKLPYGKGFWPAFWMTSQYYPFGGNGRSGEIDVFEVFGQSPTDLLTSAHWYYPSGSDCPSGRWGCSLLNKHTNVADTSGGYHTYVVEWEDRHLTWYFDGVKVFELGDGAQYQWASAAPKAGSFSPTYGEPFVQSNPMKLRINLAVGGTGPGAPDTSTPFPGVFEVDYVRVFQR